MNDLNVWLGQQGLSVRELAAGLELPLRTVENRVYQRLLPSAAHRVRLEDFMCTHHWVIDTADGHLSIGVCKLCHADREFPTVRKVAANDRHASGVLAAR